jgi:hypothetical protein
MFDGKAIWHVDSSLSPRCSYKVSPVYHACQGHTYAVVLPSGLKPREDAPEVCLIDVSRYAGHQPVSSREHIANLHPLYPAEDVMLGSMGRWIRLDGDFPNLR